MVGIYASIWPARNIPSTEARNPLSQRGAFPYPLYAQHFIEWNESFSFVILCITKKSENLLQHLIADTHRQVSFACAEITVNLSPGII